MEFLFVCFFSNLIGSDGCYLLPSFSGRSPSIRRLSMLPASPSLRHGHVDTHFLDKTRGYRLPVPVNGSLCNYDYVQPRAPRAGLSGATERHTVRHAGFQSNTASSFLVGKPDKCNGIFFFFLNNQEETGESWTVARRGFTAESF